MIDFPKETYEYYYKRGVLNGLFNWIIDSKYRKAVHLPTWIKEQIDNPSQEIINIAKSLKGKDDNKTMLYVLKYVHDTIVYTPDDKVWSMPEYWQTAQQTLIKKTGDCEDGAILSYVLARLAGVPEYKLHLTCGSVDGGGHCWLMYSPQAYWFVFMDWCYWYNNKSVEDRPKFFIVDKTIKGEDIRYKDMWFAFSESRLLVGFKETVLK